MVFALHHFIRVMHHVIPEVIKAEFIVRTVSNVRIICVATGIAVGLMLVYTIYTEAEPFKDGAVPFTVSFCEVIIYSYDMYAFACKRIQVGGERAHKGFTFTRGHFCNAAGMQYSATD